MASEYGKTWRIRLGTGAAAQTFVFIGGEGSFDWKRTSDKVDLSSKDDGNLKASSFGQQEISFSISGKVKLPDAGLQRASDVSKMSPPETDMEVTRGDIVKYAGRVGIGNFSASFPNDGPATYTFDASAVSLPTIDDLGASA